ncbi:MAG TPA: type III pantothenate kinase [Methanocorpusculum sp.]|nr:type III pantothenate kinase [Methanocorpusculum sp.]
MANLLIEIGNTALKASWSEGLTLGKTFRYQGEKMFDFIHSLVSKERPEVMVISSSIEISDEEESRLSSECSHLILMDSNRTDTVRKYGLPEYLSPDRAASITAARNLFKGKGCIIFDFGTMLSIDIVEPDGEYIGGNVSLGLRTRFKSVNRYSRNLPLVQTPDSIMQAGNSVLSSIESGIVSGIMFEIQGYISLFPEKEIVFTGGDALYFVKRMKNSIFAICNLVLMGLAIISNDYVEKEN